MEPAVGDAMVEGSTAAADAPTTRDSLLELAAERFVADGYVRTSVRDLARESDRTTGALYGHFRNKADLLAEVVALRIAELEAQVPPGASIAEGIAGPWRRNDDRVALRALLLEGAAASRRDDTIRDRLGRQQAEKLAEWAELCRASIEPSELESLPDLDALFTLVWAIQLGTGVLEAYGIDLPDAQTWADMIARLVEPRDGRGAVDPSEDQPSEDQPSAEKA
ncbi:MAG: TetR family transcriptional regulator [Acidimicrobiia bacterium]